MNHLSLSLNNSQTSPLAYFLFCSVSGKSGLNDVQFLRTGTPDAEAF